MLAAIDVPDLGASTPLWLGLLTVFVNAAVGALRGYTDDSRQWDFVGISFFALLTGLGGGFIRDILLGNLPAETLREPWYVPTVLCAIVMVLLVGRRISRINPILEFLNALALGLFAVIGAAYAREYGLPFINCVLIGMLTAIGGGMLVSVLQGKVSNVLVASTPHGLLALLGSFTYTALAQWRPAAGSFAGIAVVIAAQYLVDHFGVETRPAGSRHRGDA